MDPSLPLNRLVLSANSVADDLGFVALADLADALSSRNHAETRIIGGHMVMLHVHRWGLGRELYRETQDTDLGITPIAVKDGEIISSLKDAGYVRQSGNRYVRRVRDISVKLQNDEGTPIEAPVTEAAIDILTPAHTSRPRQNVKISDELTTTEVPGLAHALVRPGIEIELTLHRLNGEVRDVRIVLPDEVSALVLKTLAWRQRLASKDAVDMWRMLEVARAAGLRPANFEGAWSGADQVLLDAFAAPGSEAMKAITAAGSLNAAAVRQRHTRIRALMQHLLGAS